MQFKRFFKNRIKKKMSFAQNIIQFKRENIFYRNFRSNLHKGIIGDTENPNNFNLKAVNHKS